MLSVGTTKDVETYDTGALLSPGTNTFSFILSIIPVSFIFPDRILNKVGISVTLRRIGILFSVDFITISESDSLLFEIYRSMSALKVIGSIRKLSE
jgi:hypothetical protein